MFVKFSSFDHNFGRNHHLLFTILNGGASLLALMAYSYTFSPLFSFYMGFFVVFTQTKTNQEKISFVLLQSRFCLLFLTFTAI